MSRRARRSLIAQEPYDVAFTKRVRAAFNARVTDFAPHFVGPDGALTDAAGSPVALPGITPSRSDRKGDPNEFSWLSRGATIAIAANTPTNVPLLIADPYRNYLAIQNNSIANTAAGDVPPTLSIGLDSPIAQISIAVPGQAVNPFVVNLTQGEGILMDTRVWTNAIYIAWGPATNTSGFLLFGGTIVYGRSPNSPPLPPGA